MNHPSTGPSGQASGALRAYAAVTGAYWTFMLSDGALRMLVLLHFHALGFSPLTLAWLFLVYEAMGVVTNALAGWLGTRFGLDAPLLGGLLLQILALLALAALAPGSATLGSVVFVMLVQGLSGVAKDLTKTGAKSALKSLVVDENGALFRRVAWLTGSKNAIKGAGFFVGAALLAGVGFQSALHALALLLVLVLLGLTVVPRQPLGRARASARLAELRSGDPRIDRLALARLFLFASRDAWFVVGVPVFLTSALSVTFAGDAEHAFFVVGAFMALWVIGYGAVQARAPRWLHAGSRDLSAMRDDARRWARHLCLALLTLFGLALAAAVLKWPSPAAIAWTLMLGLLGFGVVFAVNASLHSYLILAFTREDRAALDVGFYYAANAAGRLLGTIASGLSFQVAGVTGCLGVASLFALIAWRCSAPGLARFGSADPT